MPAVTVIEDDLRVHGRFSAKTIALPSWTMDERAIDPDAKIAAGKRVHRHEVSLTQDGNCVAETRAVHHCRAAGKLLSIEVSCLTAPTGDRAVTIDLLKATAAADFSSVLALPISLDSAHGDCEVCRMAIVDDILAVGDVLAVAVSVSGSSGLSPAGLVVTISWDESP
jgi:hypothetical protein